MKSKNICNPSSALCQVKKWLGLGGGVEEDSNCFPIVCHFVMKLSERFQMELMVSFDEI